MVENQRNAGDGWAALEKTELGKKMSQTLHIISDSIDTVKQAMRDALAKPADNMEAHAFALHGIYAEQLSRVNETIGRAETAQEYLPLLESTAGTAAHAVVEERLASKVVDLKAMAQDIAQRLENIMKTRAADRVYAEAEQQLRNPNAQ